MVSGTDLCVNQKRLSVGDSRVSYLHKQDNAFAQNLTDGHFVVVVALEDFLLQKLASCQVKGFTWPVEPAAMEPLPTFTYKALTIHQYKTQNI